MKRKKGKKDGQINPHKVAVEANCGYRRYKGDCAGGDNGCSLVMT